MSNKSKWGKVLDGARASDTANNGQTKGAAMIMKSVSLFLASSRRASNQLKHSDGKADATGKKRMGKSKKSDEQVGKCSAKLLELMRKRTNFTKVEVEALCKIYRKLMSNCQISSKALAASTSGAALAKSHATVDGIDRTIFRELLHTTFDIVTEDVLMERIFCMWDKEREGMPLKLEGWLIGLSVFLKGTQAQKMSFCFRVYDLNNDGYLTRDEMFTLLKNSLIRHPQDEDPDEGVKDLVEIALRKFDVDKDGKVSFDDYVSTIIDEPLLIEAFGQCLPTDTAKISFLSTLLV